MTTDPELTRIVRSWLEDGVTSIPDRVLDAVMADLPATPQRRRWLPAWRDLSMNTYARVAAVAAVVAVIVIGGISVARPGLIGGQATPTPSSSSSPTKLLPLAPVAWCDYVKDSTYLQSPPDPYASALDEATQGKPEAWKTVGPEFYGQVRAAYKKLSLMNGLAPVADAQEREAILMSAWITALGDSLGEGAAPPEMLRVYAAWNAWRGGRSGFSVEMRRNFETACP